jgi:secreted PhoX family phosphatase
VHPSSDIGLTRPTPLRAMGRFRREAVAVQPGSGIVYQTEDLDDGAFYRFIPTTPGDLATGGRLQALCIRERPSLDLRNWQDERGERLGPTIRPGARLPVHWIDLEDPEAPRDDLRVRAFNAGGARFARAEGIWRGAGGYYFACTTGGYSRFGQVWKYAPSPLEGAPGEEQQPATLELYLEPNDSALVQNCDNLTVAPWGDLILCEDNDRVNYLVGVTPAGRFYRLARSVIENSEFAGSVFSPDGSTLFVNLQQAGLTLAITGPWPRA